MSFIDTIKKEVSAQVAVLVFAFFALFWFGITLFLEPGSTYHALFANSYWLMALWGGVWGLVISRRWGGLKSVMGKAMVFFSLGMLAQVFGQISYSVYYYYFQADAPYPSVGDIGFFGSIPLYIIAIILLARASGVKISFRSLKSVIPALLLPVVGLLVSYLVFLQGYEFDWSAPLVVFLDFGYPFGQAIYVSLTVLVFYLSRGVLGGVMRSKILLLLFALVVQYLADYTFLYWISNGTWYASGPNDLIYLVAYFVMTLAIIQLKTVSDQLREK